MLFIIKFWTFWIDYLHLEYQPNLKCRREITEILDGTDKIATLVGKFFAASKSMYGFLEV